MFVSQNVKGIANILRRKLGKPFKYPETEVFDFDIIVEINSFVQ